MLDVNTGSARVRRDYQRLRADWLTSLQRTFTTASVDNILLRTGMNYQPALHAFFKRRAARA
jgi:hypothetical protein